jgi:uncharacterized membrane protein YkoI
MQLSKVMLISVLITTVILGIVGGVLANSLQAAKPAESASPELIATYQAREAAYNQLIEEANQKLEKANAALQAGQTQPGQVSDTQTAAGPAAFSASFSPEKASQIAQKVAVGTDSAVLKTPELVSFEGKTAFEVIFAKGSVYVDAQNGSVLFNGTLPIKITADKAVQIASEYMKEVDVLQVDQITFRNAPIYRVIFKSGMMVYLDMSGQITYIQKASTSAPVVIASNGSSGDMQASVTNAEHEDHHDSAEHEDGD